MITIMLGISGSGKSTLTTLLARKNSAVVASADSYFSKSGEYQFDFTKLSEAHGECFRTAVEAIREGRDVIVDNTNTTAAEVAPYIALGQAYGVNVRVVYMECNPFIAADRNKHGVPAHAVFAMDNRLQKLLREWPPYWPKYEVNHGNTRIAM